MTRNFIIELEQNADSPKENFTIKPDLNTLPGCHSDIAETNGYERSDTQPDNKLDITCGYYVKTNLIKSISRQWLYITTLLIAYELSLTTKDIPLNSNPYSWLPAEVAAAVGCLLKSYWNQDSFLFNPIDQQSTSILTHENRPFTTVTTMFGSGCNPPQQPPPESSGQQAPEATTQTIGYFTRLLFSDSDDGGEDPEQHSHTLALNCFVDPCHGVCQFRAVSGTAAEWPLDDAQTPWNESAFSDDFSIINGLINLSNTEPLEETGTSFTPALSTPPIETSETQQTTGSSRLGQSLSPLVHIRPKQATVHSRQRVCNLALVGKDGQQRPCGKVFKNRDSLWSHKSGVHTAQKICEVRMIRENGQWRPCGKICRNAKALINHKHNHHNERQTSDVTVVREDGLPQPCGILCKNASALTDHKKRHHTGQRVCNLTLVAKDGQRRPCGAFCKSAQALSDHKRRHHTGPKTCDINITGENGQQRPCGKVCKNVKALSSHKFREHNSRQTCDVPVVGKDGLKRSCGTVCQNAQTLAEHKRVHQKRKPVDAGRDNDCPP
ncbi:MULTISPECIES: hypothetical protein [unclassified Endozoicomonas]|uniref:hypothetical protein n=1 Tax=unclassified Endozoicomonas TaxID=2644528 RepID=UPI003BB78AB2